MARFPATYLSGRDTPYHHRPAEHMLKNMTKDQNPPTQRLNAVERWALLRSVSVGRLTVWVEDHPDTFPINYAVDHGTLVFRTGAGTKLAAALGANPVAFEVDGVDQSTGVAWNVNIKGPAQLLKTTEELVDSFSLKLFPWEPGLKDTFVRITPTSTTGRRFTIAESAEWWTTNSQAHQTADE